MATALGIALRPVTRSNKAINRDVCTTFHGPVLVHQGRTGPPAWAPAHGLVLKERHVRRALIARTFAFADAAQDQQHGRGEGGV